MLKSLAVKLYKCFFCYLCGYIMDACDLRPYFAASLLRRVRVHINGVPAAAAAAVGKLSVT